MSTIKSQVVSLLVTTNYLGAFWYNHVKRKVLPLRISDYGREILLLCFLLPTEFFQAE